MSITVLPQQKNWGDYLYEGVSPILQIAMQQMLQKKFSDQQYQANMDRARQTNPELFTETTPIADYQKLAQGRGQMSINPNLPEDQQRITAQRLLQSRGIVIPEKIRKFAFNKEKLGSPTVNASTGEVSYKPESAFDAYYRSMTPQGNQPMPTDNLVYRDTTGQEVPAEQAKTAIDQGNTGFTIAKKEITRSGVKETIITKPEDLEKVQASKAKSDFVKYQAQDTLNTISEIEKGMRYFGISGLIPAIPTLEPEKVNWQNNVNKLLSGKIIDVMTRMKEASKTGATGFGQLSEKEGQILKDASTALKVTTSPKDAQRYLDEMKPLLQKVLNNSQSQLPPGFDPNEWEVVNE